LKQTVSSAQSIPKSNSPSIRYAMPFVLNIIIMTMEKSVSIGSNAIFFIVLRIDLLPQGKPGGLNVAAPCLPPCPNAAAGAGKKTLRRRVERVSEICSPAAPGL
jgi:hypothetical protein